MSQIADCSAHACKVQTRARRKRKFRNLTFAQSVRKKNSVLYKDGTDSIDIELRFAMESGSSLLRLFEERFLQRRMKVQTSVRCTPQGLLTILKEKNSELYLTVV